MVVFQAYQYAEGYNNTACFTNNQELRRTLCYPEFRDGENWLWYSDSVSEALNRAAKGRIQEACSQDGDQRDNH